MKTRHSNPSLTKVSTPFAWALTLLVLLAPLPLGSNRPLPWMAWTFVLAVLMLLFILTITFKTPGRALRSGTLAPLYALGLSFLLYTLLQTLPLGLTTLQLPNDLTLLFPSDYISLTPAATTLGALRITGYGILFFLIYETATRHARRKRMGWALFLGVSLYAAGSMIALKLLGDLSLAGEKTAYLGSATGPFINRNSFATFLGMGFCLGLALLFDRANQRANQRSIATPTLRLETALLWLCLALIAIALVSTQSRMGVFATALGAGLVIYRMKPPKTWRLMAMLLVPLVLLFAGNVANRSLLTAIDLGGRAELWAQSLDLLKHRPLTGFGLDSFAHSFALQHTPPLARDVIWEYAHNSYLTLWIESGLIFGSLPILALLWGGVKLLRAPNPQDPIPTAALAILVLGGTHSLVDFSLEMQANAFLFTTVFAMGLASLHPRKKPTVT